METIYIEQYELVDLYAYCGVGMGKITDSLMVMVGYSLQADKYAVSGPVLDTVIRSLRVITIQQVYYIHILIAVVDNCCCHKIFRSTYY